MTDEEIVKFILFGGEKREAALVELYKDEICKRKVIQYVRNNQGNESDGKDLFHDGIIVVDRNIRQLKFRGDSSLHHYIYSVCKFLWLNKLKKKRRMVYSDEEKTLDEVVEKNPESILLKNELKDNLSSTLDLLGIRCKKILELWKLNYSMKEIAEICEISSESMARKLKHQCYQKLLKIVEENPGIRRNLKRDDNE